MLSKNKLDSLNIQEIDNLQAESISGGAFIWRRNNNRQGRAVLGTSTSTHLVEPGDNYTVEARDNNDGDRFFVTYFFDGNTVLDFTLLDSGERTRLPAPDGTNRLEITQVARPSNVCESDFSDLAMSDTDFCRGNVAGRDLSEF